VVVCLKAGDRDVFRSRATLRQSRIKSSKERIDDALCAGWGCLSRSDRRKMNEDVVVLHVDEIKDET